MNEIIFTKHDKYMVLHPKYKKQFYFKKYLDIKDNATKSKTHQAICQKI